MTTGMILQFQAIISLLVLLPSSIRLDNKSRGIGKSEAYVDPDGETWKTLFSCFPFSGRIFDKMDIPFSSFKLRNSAILANITSVVKMS